MMGSVHRTFVKSNRLAGCWNEEEDTALTAIDHQVSQLHPNSLEV
jgi:hypothetical protein